LHCAGGGVLVEVVVVVVVVVVVLVVGMKQAVNVTSPAAVPAVVGAGQKQARQSV
jgi:hypothetical protein